MIVLDASALLEILLRTAAGHRAESRLAQDGDGCAPHLIDVEVVQALRRLAAARQIGETRAREAVEDFADMPLQRYAHEPLVERMWSLRQNLTAYDAAYVALAEALGAPLLTTDRRLASAPGHRARIELA